MGYLHNLRITIRLALKLKLLLTQLLDKQNLLLGAKMTFPFHVILGLHLQAKLVAQLDVILLDLTPLIPLTLVVMMTNPMDPTMIMIQALMFPILTLLQWEQFIPIK